MFMVLSYPWPVASAYGQRVGPKRPGGASACYDPCPDRPARTDPGTSERDLRRLVRLTGWQRLRFSCCRFLLPAGSLS
jgi:hypothetical protein